MTLGVREGVEAAAAADTAAVCSAPFGPVVIPRRVRTAVLYARQLLTAELSDMMTEGQRR